MNYNPTLHKLSNGVTVILDPMDGMATTNVNVVFGTGSRDESPSEYGLTHFCEHIICNGTTRFDSFRMIKDYVEDNGGEIGAATSNQYIRFYGEILSENTSVLLDVIADMLFNSTLQKIENERTVILDELRRAQDNDNRRFINFLSDKIFDGAMNQYRTLGTEKNIMSFTRDQVQAHITQRMTARNCLVCISGKIDQPQDLLKTIEKLFADLPQTDVVNNYIPATYNAAIVHKTKETDKNVRVVLVFPWLYSRTFDNKYANMCVGRFLANLQEHLMDVLREENGLLYGIGSESFGPDDFCGVNGFSFRTAPENMGRCIELAARTSYDVYTNNPAPTEFLQRRWHRGHFGNAKWLESAERRCRTLISEYLDYQCLYDYDKYTGWSHQISSDDVMRYTRGFFDGPMSIVTQGADFDADLGAVWRENFK